MNDTINSKAAKSVVWSFAEKLSVQGFGFGISLILARLLLPEDYGTIAMLYIFTSVATVFIDGGFSNALIQNQERTERDFSTAFYVNVGAALFCYALLFIMAPYIADFFNQPLLNKVTRVYGLSLVISSFALVQKSRFYINCNFRVIAYISFFAIIIGGSVAILMAYHGFGVWALVCYHLIVESLRTVGLWIMGHWYPRLTFSKKSFIMIFNFGSKLLGANILNVVASNLYTFVIGKLFNATSLGFYSRGQSMSYILPSNFSNIMTQASYPILCEVQNDKRQLRHFFLKYIKMSFVIMAPVMTILATLASPLVSLVLTDKWLPCVPFIQILAIGYMFDPVMRLNANVINVTGHSEYSFYAELYKKIALLVILFATCFWGINLMVWGLAFYSIADLLIVSFYVKRVVGVGFFDEVKLMLPQIIYCLVMFLVIYSMTMILERRLLQLFVGSLVGLSVYAMLMLGFSRSVLYNFIKLFKASKK